MLSEFYKKRESDVIWWAGDPDKRGMFFFSFDRKKIYNLFMDYPEKLSKEEKEIFDNENPFWVDYFKE